MGTSPGRRTVLASRKRRLFYSLSAIAVVMVIGTVGIRQLESMSWIDAIYFESMLATGQGPPIPLTTDAGKIFASVMGFASFGAVFTSLVVTLVPIVSQLWREGLERVETDAKALEREISAKKKEEQ